MSPPQSSWFASGHAATDVVSGDASGALSWVVTVRTVRRAASLSGLPAT